MHFPKRHQEIKDVIQNMHVLLRQASGDITKSSRYSFSLMTKESTSPGRKKDARYSDPHVSTTRNSSIKQYPAHPPFLKEDGIFYDDYLPLRKSSQNGWSRHLSEKLDTSSRTEAILEEERLKVGTWRPSSVITLQGMRLMEAGGRGDVCFSSSAPFLQHVT
ncbi:hypothetical protein TNCV_4095201 [Trichonephila clavipes]|uniref:Uncharacterized protein n=1 Tax=Trichonephila clavipes TaxID=2585209 RepID=A0A8X6SAH2_TRICX|nr:hypothetical protein TNCV_4095201 [Trichonephila clavipes]